MIKVFIADDHAILREGLVQLLEKTGLYRVVGQASDGRTALDLLRKDPPDVAVLDITMPEMSGIEVAERLIRSNLSLKIIFLTMMDDPATVSKAIKLGVDGYVLKENAFDDLLYAMKSAIAGQKFISPVVTAKLHEYLENREKSLNILTPREQEVLKLIAEGMSSREIAHTLNISVKTVDTHRERIMLKLDIHKVAELVKFAINSGLIR